MPGYVEQYVADERNNGARERLLDLFQEERENQPQVFINSEYLSNYAQAELDLRNYEYQYPGMSHSDMLEHYLEGKAFERAIEQHDRGQSPFITEQFLSPAEEAAKEELTEILLSKHSDAIDITQSYGARMTLQEFSKLIESRTGNDMDRLVRENPNASYADLLAIEQQKEFAKGYDVGPDFPKNEVGLMPGFENGMGM